MPSIPPFLGTGRRRWWVLALVLVLGGAGAWWQLAPAADPTSTAITATVSRGTYKSTVSATGTITPKKETGLSFTSTGTVTQVAVKAGDKVTKGDLLAAIDPTALEAQRDAASSQLTAAKSQLAEDSGSSSAQVASDQAAVAAAQSALTQATEALANATLRAPFTGTVSAVDYAVGDQAGTGGNQPAADGSSSTSGITVISPSKLLVEATVSAADVSTLKSGMQAEITPTGGGEVVYGTVSAVGALAEASETGAAEFPVTIEVTGKPTGLYAGSSATVEIVVKQATDVLTVPTQAVRAEDGTTYVYVLDENKKRTKKTVTLGTAYGMQTEVLTGLTEGDTVEVMSFQRSTSGNDGGGQQPGGEIRMPAGGTDGGPGGGPVFGVGP